VGGIFWEGKGRGVRWSNEEGKGLGPSIKKKRDEKKLREGGKRGRDKERPSGSGTKKEKQPFSAPVKKRESTLAA